MMRRLLLLVAGLVLSACNLEEAERMELDRSGPSTIMPELQGLHVTDEDANPLGDTLRLFNPSWFPEAPFILSGRWDASGDDSYEYECSIREIWPDGTASDWRLAAFGHDGELGMIYGKLRAPGEAETSHSALTGPGLLQIRIRKIQDGHAIREIFRFLPVFFLDDRPRITNLAIQGGIDSID